MPPQGSQGSTNTFAKRCDEKPNSKTFQAPTLNLNRIREAVPAHCFIRSNVKSFSYLLADLIYVAIIWYLATFIDQTASLHPIFPFLLWPIYWVAQGIVATGLWVLAHECGHQAFSESKWINDTVGFILHSALLVPYFSWQISHSQHHKATNHLEKDQVFVPTTRSDRNIPKSVPSVETVTLDHNDSAFGASPIASLKNCILMFLFGWPSYLIINISGPKKFAGASHFKPSSPIFKPSQHMQIALSTGGVVLTLAILTLVGFHLGFFTVFKYYVVPYLIVNFWLVLITYLQHTDSSIPHYRDGEWTFLRGALCTVDRDFGPLLNRVFHHITDTHVAHHLFSRMPHYHAVEATRCIRPLLGEHYRWDDTHWARVLWRNITRCQFVEDDGDIVFWQTLPRSQS